MKNCLGHSAKSTFCAQKARPLLLFGALTKIAPTRVHFPQSFAIAPKLSRHQPPCPPAHRPKRLPALPQPPPTRAQPTHQATPHPALHPSLPELQPRIKQCLTPRSIPASPSSSHASYQAGPAFRAPTPSSPPPSWARRFLRAYKKRCDRTTTALFKQFDVEPLLGADITPQTEVAWGTPGNLSGLKFCADAISAAFEHPAYRSAS